MNKQLVKGFMKNVKVLLRRKGEIRISHKVGEPYNKWKLVKKAEKIGLILHECVAFSQRQISGYVEGGMGTVSLAKSNAATEAGAHIVIDTELQKAIEEEKVPGNRKVRLSASMKLLQSPISQAKGTIDRQLHIRLRKERSLLCTLTGRESIDFFQALSALPYRTMSVEGTS
ncbi:hypothetical protein GIB67_042608 [Kingdonia uniflora]|uniref:25S rRNA (uridine-N(3))-methyltransferase BMT5-like domain-containing protein n=1 Tax=Kingdonia uniflora TaxID=39325 RepID=A0A7J7M188_9MAGN|nr:hypothetical protein GIB67_042608 [Kingdonia uniflora]